ncbi:MAG: GSCFA domain-containing protein [Bacteroidales bacterium]|nr:GSCFA domain-containing protein [Bacteroidales bacterium]
MSVKSSFINSDGFRTIVTPGKSDHPLSHRQGIMLIGSCFTGHIGNNLASFKFNTCLNPFGIVYHPVVIANQIARLLSQQDYSDREIVFHDGVWNSFDHHGKFSDPDKDRCISLINNSLAEASVFIRSAGHLVLTFGTARAYLLKENGHLVANCHKFPDSCFETRMYEPEQILDSLVPVLDALLKLNPAIHFIWTVSPVRYLKEGPLGNQITKSNLIRTITGLLDRYPDSFYFPAYEIFMDDLRDYRFYDTDLIHPGDAGIAYVWQRLMESCITPESLTLMKEIEPVIKSAGHRQNGRNIESHRRFQQSQREKVAILQKEYPFLDFTTEWELFNRKVD